MGILSAYFGAIFPTLVQFYSYKKPGKHFRVETFLKKLILYSKSIGNKERATSFVTHWMPNVTKENRFL